ncbi:MAG: hypothetical protein NXI10_15910 [bacterium]|nr:hypothetical protein [bacterium]
MENKEGGFKDPKGRFVMKKPESWIFEENEKTKTGVYQFKISESCGFTISCLPINDFFKKIIESEKLVPHNFEHPTIGFVEKIKHHGDTVLYTWMSVVDDLFCMAAYSFDENVKPGKDVGMDLLDVRTSLQTLIFLEKREKYPKQKKEKKKDYSDIENWRERPSKFFDYWTSDKKSKPKSKGLSTLDIDTVKLYALIKAKVSSQPNGIYDLVRTGMPLDSMIWWDFVLECDKGFIHLWRTPHKIEVIYRFDGELDIKSFFDSNIVKYSAEIEKTIDAFDKHTIYINHYESYRGCVSTLFDEIMKIDLTPPNSPSEHLTNKKELDKYYKELNTFLNNSIKYHALAKSLVLNAAFKVESYLNLVIRIGALPELRNYPDVLDKFLRQDFSHRVKNFQFYTQIFVSDFDLSDSVYRETKELMTLRNKYVHYEEDAIHNRIGEIYYDRDCPLHQLEKDRPAVETFRQTFHKPDIERVKKSYKTSNDFISTIENLIVPEIREEIKYLTSQNPLGYNESKGMYSSVIMPNAVDFFAIGEPKKENDK